MDASNVVAMLTAAVSAMAAVVGAWVGYLQYRDRRAPATPATTGSPVEGPGTPAPRRHQGDRATTGADDVGAAAATGAGAQGVDQWNVEWTTEKLARRATAAVRAAVVSCVCLVTILLIGVLTGADGSVDDPVAAALGWVMGMGVVAVLVATVLAVRVRRAARGRYRRPWRSATLALWLAWAPWVAGYLPLVRLY